MTAAGRVSRPFLRRGTAGLQPTAARGTMWRLWWVVALALLAGALPARAHDVPTDTRVRAFVKTEGQRLHVLLRMPLGLLLNADLPKQGPGYLALGQIDDGLQRALRAVDQEVGWYENGRRLVPSQGRARISLPSDTAFRSFDGARALIDGPPLPASSYVFWNQGYFDAHLEYAIESGDSTFALEFRVAPALKDRLRLDLRYQLPGGAERAFELAPTHERVVLDPRWHQAAWTFLVWGFEHILQGPDHLLFLLCLVLPFQRMDAHLVGVVSAFTVAHSVTLIAAAYGLAPDGAWFVPLVETLIAASILYMAVENVLRPRLPRRWAVSGVFGLVHGFGFSFLLQSQLQFAGSNLLVSLVAFNVGVELGQVLVMLLVLPAVAAWRALVPHADRAITAIVGLLAGHVAWHWLVERGAALRTAAEGTAVLATVALTGALLLGAALLRARRRPPPPSHRTDVAPLPDTPTLTGVQRGSGSATPGTSA